VCSSSTYDKEKKEQEEKHIKPKHELKEGRHYEYDKRLTKYL